MTEDQAAPDGEDHVTAFARRHRLDERELRDAIAAGPRWVRWLLANEGIYDDFPRRAPAARANDGAQK